MEVMGEVIWIWVGLADENWLLVGEACIAEAGVVRRGIEPVKLMRM